MHITFVRHTVNGIEHIEFEVNDTELAHSVAHRFADVQLDPRPPNHYRFGLVDWTRGVELPTNVAVGKLVKLGVLLFDIYLVSTKE